MRGFMAYMSRSWMVLPNSSGVNTPIPKMKILYMEPMALASLIDWRYIECFDEEYFMFQLSEIEVEDL